MLIFFRYRYNRYYTILKQYPANNPMFPGLTFPCKTNFSLQETIEICANALYDDDLVPPPFPREIFIELMQTGFSSVEFNFNDTMYQQINGVAMGSPLGPALVHIFVGYQENKIFLNVKKPLNFYRYVDDTFAFLKKKIIVKNFFLHSTLFTLHYVLRSKKNLTLSSRFWTS